MVLSKSEAILKCHYYFVAFEESCKWCREMFWFLTRHWDKADGWSHLNLKWVWTQGGAFWQLSRWDASLFWTWISHPLTEDLTVTWGNHLSKPFCWINFQHLINNNPVYSRDIGTFMAARNQTLVCHWFISKRRMFFIGAHTGTLSVTELVKGEFSDRDETQLSHCLHLRIITTWQ